MQLERDGPDGLAIVLDDGARHVVTGARVSTHYDVPPSYSGDRAYWTEASVHETSGALFVRVVGVIDHDGGTDRASVTVFRSSDGGRRWSLERTPPRLRESPELASLSTEWSALEAIGEYRLIRRIGKGALGEVYEAFDVGRARVALKVLSGVSGDMEARARLRDLGARLLEVHHPNMAFVHGLVDRDDAPPFVVTELLEGEPLASALASGALPPERARQIASDMLAGLEAAHAHGLVHGDLRPANVFVPRRSTGRTVLADFGILAAIEDPRGTRSSTRTEIAYLPLDGLHPASPDARADVYSAGACLYEMLAGRPPFGPKPSRLELLAEIATSDPAPLTTIARTPPALAAIVERAMAKDPSARFPTVAAMRAALDAPGSG